MKKIITILLLTTLGLITSLVHADDYHIDHLEPAFWWVGMHHDKLQLMVHGKHIGDLTPEMTYPGVRIESVIRVPNNNYLFVNLVIDNSAAPGKFDLRFKAGKAQVTYSYELRAREKNSAQRIGFNSSDTILNLMPDRFANGNAANDSTPRLREKADRTNSGGRHGGDIQGIIDHLDYIADMGYTAIWPTPVVENDQPKYSYHGYSATNFYLIDERFGSNEDYRRLSLKAREKGIGLIQDVVLNHIGSGHWWMKDMPMKDWINFDGKFVPTKHFRYALNDLYASNEDKIDFTKGWFSPDMPDMNQANPLVATYQIQNSIWWIEYAGLAGLRIDTYGYSDTAFLTQWGKQIMEEYPNFNMVGEEWSVSPALVSHWQSGKKNYDGYVSYLPSLMDFPLNDAMRKALVVDEGWNGGLMGMYEALAHDYLYPNPSNLVFFEGNHDMARIFSVLNDDVGLFKMAIANVLTVPRIPQLYYGTEILMSSPKERDDAGIRHDFPGGWAGDNINAFTGAGLSSQQLDAQAFVKKLLNWRKSQPVIHHGKTMQYGPEKGSYVYFRYDANKKVMVVFNKNKLETVLATERFHEMLDGVASGTDVITGKQYALNGQLRLPARSVLILELDRKAVQ